ncbi:MAG: hypothetical protein ACRCXK_10545 [Wohlfahrtiimonas sp.]
MIIADLVEHIEKDEEQIYILKNEPIGVTCYVTAIIDGEFKTLSKWYKTES